MIKREAYIKKIAPFINKDIIKVITGIRRCGKSVLLEQIRDYLISSKICSEKQILFLNFESLNDKRVHSITNVLEAIKQMQGSKKQKLYFFFDEIQELREWEKLVNSLLIDYDSDIYITGSNANLLSGELATYLSGRYIEIQMYPFSFKESFDALKQLDISTTKEIAFNEYLKTGGFPFLYNYSFSDEQKTQYLNDLFNSIILKDISACHKIRDIALLKKLIAFFINNISRPFSAISISKYLKSEKRSVSSETIYNYLEYTKEAFLLYLSSRFDLIDKEMLTTNEKIFIADHGFMNLFTQNITANIDQVLENIVYIELLRRGYEVFVGKNKDKEIDFYTLKNGKISYFQVCYLLSNTETIAREFGGFDKITDNYPKYVLSLDNFDFSRNGIVHKNLISWLAENEY